MSRKRNRNNKNLDLEFALTLNGSAKMEGPKQKSWTKHDLKSIRPLTENQHSAFDGWYDNYNLCLAGSAGTGKTFLAFHFAFNSLFNFQEQERIILVRSAVPAREVGFLPGNLDEKIAQYELPYKNICYELLGKPNSYDYLKEAHKLEFTSTSFIRGLTIDNAIIIIDEAANLTLRELDAVLTRVGHNTRVIICGDQIQSDFTRKGEIEGLTSLLKITQRLSSFKCIKFDQDDIVRSSFVKEYIILREELGLVA